jgi:hypothetical protein
MQTLALFTVAPVAWIVAYLVSKWRGGPWLLLAYLGGVGAGLAATLGLIALRFYFETANAQGVAGPAVVLSVIAPLVGIWSGRRAG